MDARAVDHEARHRGQVGGSTLDHKAATGSEDFRQMQGHVALQVIQHRIRRVDEHQVIGATGGHIGLDPTAGIDA